MINLSGILGVLLFFVAVFALFAENFIVMGLLCIAGAILFDAAAIANAIENKN